MVGVFRHTNIPQRHEVNHQTIIVRVSNKTHLHLNFTTCNSIATHNNSKAVAAAIQNMSNQASGVMSQVSRPVKDHFSTVQIVSLCQQLQPSGLQWVGGANAPWGEGEVNERRSSPYSRCVKLKHRGQHIKLGQSLGPAFIVQKNLHRLNSETFYMDPIEFSNLNIEQKIFILLF